MSTDPTQVLLAAAQEITRLQGIENSARARRVELEAILDQPSQKLRVALGTPAPEQDNMQVAEEVITLPVKRGPGRPKKVTPVAASVPMSNDTAPASGGDLLSRIRAELSERSMTAGQLAQVLRIDTDTLSATLSDLRRAGQLHRFDEDDAFIWCIGDVPGGERRAFVTQLLAERHLSREGIRRAIGSPPGDNRAQKYRVKDADNALDFIRTHLPVWAQSDIRGNNLYWLVRNKDGTYQKPPKELNGAMNYRDRTRPKKTTRAGK